MENKPRYISEKEVSEITGIALSTLRNYRAARQGIPFTKYGTAVRYKYSDVIEYMEAHKIETEN